MNCYNGAKYLREAIDTVLAQTYANWELVFWDNQSTDASAEICQSYNDTRIKYFYAPRHTNLGEARALAYEKVTGDFVAVLDTDDLWEPEKLAHQMPVFADAQVAIAISDAISFTVDGKTRRRFANSEPPQGYVFEQLLDNYFVGVETLILRRSSVASLSHAFDTALSHISDFDLVVRLAKDWKLAYTPEVLAYWRVHAASGSWAEPEKFFREKMQFVDKIDALPELASAWQPVRRRFLARTVTSEAMTMLSNGEVTICREMLRPYRWGYWRATAINTLSFLPFGDRLVKCYRKKKLCLV
jgi:glycosyltransferase involved in cell wall biosynthesis